MTPPGWGLWGRLGGARGKGRAPLTPDQRMSADALEQEKVHEVVAKQDTRYDAMTDAQRQQYYLKPKLMTKIKKALRGS